MIQVDAKPAPDDMTHEKHRRGGLDFGGEPTRLGVVCGRREFMTVAHCPGLTDLTSEKALPGLPVSHDAQEMDSTNRCRPSARSGSRAGLLIGFLRRQRE
jgi:hypothetical protein